MQNRYLHTAVEIHSFCRPFMLPGFYLTCDARQPTTPKPHCILGKISIMPPPLPLCRYFNGYLHRRLLVFSSHDAMWMRLMAWREINRLSCAWVLKFLSATLQFRRSNSRAINFVPTSPTKTKWLDIERCKAGGVRKIQPPKS